MRSGLCSFSSRDSPLPREPSHRQPSPTAHSTPVREDQFRPGMLLTPVLEDPANHVPFPSTSCYSTTSREAYFITNMFCFSKPSLFLVIWLTQSLLERLPLSQLTLLSRHRKPITHSLVTQLSQYGQRVMPSPDQLITLPKKLSLSGRIHTQTTPLTHQHLRPVLSLSHIHNPQSCQRHTSALPSP